MNRAQKRKAEKQEKTQGDQNAKPASEPMKKLSDFSVIELKAMVYDQQKILANAKMAVQKLNEEIAKRAKGVSKK